MSNSSKFQIDYSDINEEDFSQIPHIIGMEVKNRPNCDTVTFEIPNDKIKAFYEEYISTIYDPEMTYEDFLEMMI